MSFLDRFFKHRLGKIIISIVWGLGLATLFRRVCKGRNCIIIKSPKLKDIEGKIYKYNRKCYKFESAVTSCKPKSGKTIIENYSQCSLKGKK